MRLPNGFGSVYKLSGNRRKPWIARKTVGWTPEGKQQYYTVGYFKTRSEAIAALTEYNKNPIGELTHTTFQEVYDKWSETKFNSLTKSTANNYRAAWKHLSVLKEMPINAIRKSHLQDVIDDMLKQGLSRSSCEKVKTLAVVLFDEAMGDDIVSKNYASLVTLPKSRKAKKTIFAETDIKKVENLARKGDIWAGTILILIYSGMRISELLNLTKFNVDIDNWFITGGVKTDAGKDRIIPIHSKIRQYISYWYSRPGSHLVDRDGEKISVDYYRKYIFYPTIERAEIEKELKPHSTRHTFATLANKAGVKTKDIQDLIGHTDYATTANIYTHPDVEELRKAIELL